MTTPYHAKYFAHELTRQAQPGGVDRLSMALFDVVINFLNERNEADRRAHELLAEKFNLFSGVFGASDEVLGQIESGVDFEKRILAIYQKCRTPQEIDAAFKQLQAEMDETIQSKIDETRQMLMEHFDEDVLFSAIFDEGATGGQGDGAKWKALDQETCQKLFHCSATVSPPHPLVPSPPPQIVDRLKEEAGRHAEATITHSLEGNNALFNEERERLEKWADDMVVAAEKDLSDTKAQIKAVRRQSRLATTLDEQNELQQKLRDLEKRQRKQRQQIFEIEDQIAEKRDTLIDGLQKRMTQKTHSTHLFTIQWEVV